MSDVAIPIRRNYKVPAMSLAVVVFACCQLMAGSGSGQSSDAPTSSAICPIVYSLDQFPSVKGSRYLFYGNAFFINKEGYLITAAHVVSAFRDGGRPNILVGPAGGPRHLQEAELVAADWEHDVALLRATPNPFESEHDLTFLPLTTATPSRGNSVFGFTLRPSDPENADTSEAPLEERSSGEVLDYQFTQTENGADSELLLLSQRVVPGDSGSPVISASSLAVVGIVVGRWLRPSVIPFGTGADLAPPSPGAALRIHYAVALLRERGISWQSASDSSVPADAAAQKADGYTPPAPLSMVATPYPPQALFGGEVVLDALIDANGKLADLRVVRGPAPFLEAVLGAVHTWSFLPALLNGHAVEGRLGIVFQFPQSFLPPLTSREHKYEEPSADSPDRGALPIATIEPDYPVTSIADGTVVLYDVVDKQGQVTSTDVLRDVGSLTAPTVAASRQWRFSPGENAGANTESAVVIVVTFRRPALARR